MKAAFDAAKVTAVHGPGDVPLIDQAVLHLPVTFAFVPSKEAQLILRAMGNRVGDNLLGVIFPTAPASEGFIAVQYVKSGYIKDDDAKEWDADELLANLKTGTEEANKERKARGIPEMEITGWVERPHYDAATHQLKWSMASKDRGAAVGDPQGINYNTFALGREGYISMNLVTDLSAVEAQKPVAAQLLAGLKFNNGKTYSDFNSSTDKVAEYGLAALIGGIAAKKLGLLALAGVFLAKFFKVIVVGGLALAGGLFKWRKKKKAAELRATSAAPTDALQQPPAAPPQ